MQSSDTGDALVIKRMTGRVKWFDEKRGYGFIIPDGGGPEIILHENPLHRYGQYSASEGSHVVADVRLAERGWQVVDVVDLTPPETIEVKSNLGSMLSAEELAAMDFKPVRVKWFDKRKGYGFVHAFGEPSECFLHADVLRLAGLTVVEPGEALAAKIISADRGRQVVKIARWEVGMASGRSANSK